MRILYVYNENALDRNMQSGRPFAIYKHFQTRGHEVINLFPLRRRWDFSYGYSKYKAYVSGKLYGGERHISYLLWMKEAIEKSIERWDPDCIFSPSSIPLSLVTTGRCRIFSADATFQGLASSYPRLRKISEQYAREARFQEWIALRTADFCVYPSDWAALSAIQDYGADRKKVKIIPFGANIEPTLSQKEIGEYIERRDLSKLSFVFVGIDWERKGGAEAVRLIEMLNENGILAHLHVIGVSMPNTPVVTYHGFLDKGDKHQQGRFDELMLKSHFFILPTLAEAFGLSFCEAMSYGLPCIANDVGGVGGVIEDNRNGFFLRQGAGGEQFLKKIQFLSRNSESYLSLCRNARHDYETKFIWDRFVAGIEELVAGPCFRRA